MVAFAGVGFVFLFVGVAFGLAWGLAIAEPKYKTPALHTGEWGKPTVEGRLVMWQRKGERRKKCHDDHRPFVCTIGADMSHVDACDCGATRQGVFGVWH